MKSIPSKVPSCQKRKDGRGHPPGFALVVTLSLMILLTVIAVGLLGLSSISLRSSSRNDAMQTARANAKMALLLAIGDLQKQLGPDTRITATADQITAADPSVSSTPSSQRNWAGAYKSWAPGLPADARPSPEFIQWFVSGDPNKTKSRNFADTAVSGSSSVEIVTQNTVGPDDHVTVPKITQTTGSTKNGYAWWVSDLGTKALIAPSKPVPTGLGDVRADLQAIPTTNLKAAAIAKTKPFENIAADFPNLSRVYSWSTAELLSDSGTKPDIRGLYHHYTTQNRGLLTNVRSGGFRKDLSMALERPATGSGSLAPPDSTSTALYKVNGETGINLQELWVYYNSYKEVKRSGSHLYTTGGALTSGTPYVLVDPSPTASRNDDEFYLKQPVIISYQIVLSLKNVANKLEIVADPIITLWNPLDVAVVIPANIPLTVKFWQIPYDLLISKNGSVPVTYPLSASLQESVTTSTGGSEGDANFMSLRMGKLGRLVFKPGEVIKFSQASATFERDFKERHKLDGKPGFNFGGGISMPVRDYNKNNISLSALDTLSIQAKPNKFTAGATKSDGFTIETGGVRHTRHFSLTHFEYYYGEDRESNGDSLGIGTMAIDWDFGNRRLKPNELRAENTPGTKPSGERLYANDSRFKDIFITTELRDNIPAAALTAKQPFMLLSFNAKTEVGGARKTKSLSRFNPKALHVDFYDLSEKERDILPYECTVDSLTGWKSDKLQISNTGSGYFGGSMEFYDGTNLLTTHSFPREPTYSLAAFQHSFANGFDVQKPKYDYAILNSREPMLPQISHAIGNSAAPSMMKSTATEGTLPGGRPMADHSYLANQGLWDTWFLSGIAPQSTSGTFSVPKPQKALAQAFFDPNATSPTKLPVARYVANPRGKTPAQIISTYFPGTVPNAKATDEIASYLLVDGMFNVNSTSVEAWKSMLGSRFGRPVVARDASGKDVIVSDATGVPVAALLTPDKSIAAAGGSVTPNSPEQWTGRRILSEDEIDALARGIVKEVRKRGPFLSLADFVNRRIGSDAELAKSGAIQSALDSQETKINNAYTTGSRAVGSASSRMDFPNAEEGPISQGIPGIVKQADILTPIAPVLSARSDSFMIRAYGEKTDGAGKVIASACCEAVIQRSAEFVDPGDPAEKSYDSINTINQTFGRHFEIVSFRWLSPSEV